MDEAWKAWFAGFCDGEACFYIRTDGSPEFSVSQRDDNRWAIEDAARRLGVGSVTAESKQCMRDKGAKAGDQVRLRICGKGCLKVIDVLEQADTETYWDDWFAGFVEAEGHFRVNPDGSARFEVAQRDDNGAVIEEIQRRLGVGSVTVGSMQYARDKGRKSRDVVYIQVCGENCLEIIKRLEGRMRTKKAEDFKIWAEAVRFAASQKRGAPGKKERMLEYKRQLEAAREYVPPVKETT